MFQLAMSHIHDEAHNNKHDSDSAVGNIEDGLVALQAFQAYIAQLGATYGTSFTLAEDFQNGTGTLLSAWAHLPNNPRGPSTVYVELQRPTPLDDVERIVDLMRVKAHYTHSRPTD